MRPPATVDPRTVGSIKSTVDRHDDDGSGLCKAGCLDPGGLRPASYPCWVRERHVGFLDQITRTAA